MFSTLETYSKNILRIMKVALWMKILFQKKA